MFYLGLFLALSLIWLWPAPLRLTSRLAGDLGDPVLVTWILWWNTQAVPFTGRWWSAPIFYPLPDSLALSEHLLGIAVFTSPLQLAGVNAIGAYNIALILSFWLSGFFAFLLGRRLTGSSTAGVVAGMAFAFAPYRIGQLSHLHVLTAQWMPAALFAMHAYLSDRRARWLVLFAVAWLLQALSNGYFLLFFPVLIAAWLAWFVRWKRDPRPGMMLSGTFILSSALLLPVLLKYREVHGHLGLSRQVGEMVFFSADLGSLTRMSEVLKFWPYVQAKTGEDLLFPGITAIVLILAAAASASRWPRLKRAAATRSPFIFYTLATPLFWWLALGPAVDGHLQSLLKPYTWLMVLPGFTGLRAPARFAMLATLTLSVAAALAFHRLQPSRRFLRAALAVAVFSGLTIDGWIEAVPQARPIARVDLPEVQDAVVLELPVNDGSVATASMFRMTEHGLPIVNGYSGHTPRHHRIMSAALNRADPTAILHFAEARPLIIVVNNQFDVDRWHEEFVRALPGVRSLGASAAGPVFLLPPQPRPRSGALGPRLRPVFYDYGAREHVTLDLGARHIIRTLSFPLRWQFEKLQPRLEVEASLDGTTWTRAWFGWTGGIAISGALENPQEVPFRIHLPDVEAQYLRIHPAQGWMIRELSIYGAK